MLDFRAGKMPKNVSIYEFFGKAGSNLQSPHAQQNHLNSNYMHVVRDAFDFGTNVFGQLIGCRKINGRMVYSMGCNTDICVGANEEIHKKRLNGEKVAIIREERMQFGMSGVEKVNQLYGDEVLRSLQRKDGRFVNTGMMASQIKHSLQLRPLFNPQVP